MKDEIKETITRMASYTIHYVCCSEGDAEEDIEKILDYITNLQEENEIRQIDINNLTYQLAKEKEDKEKAIEKLESIRIFGLRSGKTLFSTLINETIDILKGESYER